VVPNLIGKTLTQARTALRHAGCSLGTVSHAAGRRGRVIAQHPAPHARRRHGARVAVTIGRG
jgi:beta-lactam-binding protein with PASTA domain